MKKKIFALVALFLCALGTAFADILYNSEAEAYNAFTQMARSYKYVYIVEMDCEDEDNEFQAEELDDDMPCIIFYGKYDAISAVFANDSEKFEKAIADEMGDEWYHWRRVILSGSGSTKALNYFKALIEVCK